jgi:hypothetical protein
MQAELIRETGNLTVTSTMSIREKTVLLDKNFMSMHPMMNLFFYDAHED